jgi:glutamate N-acetyltransferase/amino-acid N-acetyltransferase
MSATAGSPDDAVTTTSDAATGVTAPQGFRAAGVTAGLKTSGRPDLALVVNDGPARAAAAVFTSNRVQAAPVRWTRAVLRAGEVDAVILNSGGANACTGPEGYADSAATAERVADLLGTEPGRVAVCSTGLIGERLPMGRLLAGAVAAVAGLAADGGREAAVAIMTTDTVPKTVVIRRPGFTVGGMAKGAGMLAPGLATMLVVLTTDAAADAATLDAALRAAVRTTFDRLDSDGAMSTNDTVLLLASGASGVRPDQAGLTEAVTAACDELARALLSDAEGATKDIAIEVRHAATEDDAVEVGRAVARNNLVKTAFFGCDPNWGRILAAVGTTAAAFDPDALDVAINGAWICRAGGPGVDRATVDLSRRDVHVVIDLHAGDAAATVRTNDLSLAYVHENSAYST